MAAETSFRVARVARHRLTAQRRPFRLEITIRHTVYTAGLSAAGLLLTVDRPVHQAAGVLLALLVVFGWRHAERGLVRAIEAQAQINALRRAAQMLDQLPVLPPSDVDAPPPPADQ